MPKRQQITESRPVVLTEAVDRESGTFELQIIDAGWGSSGYYSAEVLEAAVESGVFGKGTHLYLDHPTASEEYERPERSVTSLAGALNEDARWNGTAVVASATVLSPYRTLLAEAAPLIGMSIRGGADVSEGKAEGRSGRIIEKITAIDSVDFVTRAGRGGAVLAVIESARTREAGQLDSDRRERMQQAVTDAYPSDEKTGAWIRDFDDDVIYVEVWGGDNAGTYRRTYTTDAAGAVTITGDPVEVVAHTTYVPVNAAGDGTTTESDGGHQMEIAESELTSLRESAGRVPTLEAERDTAIAERDAAVKERDETKARTAAEKRARERVVEANGTLDADVVDRIVDTATRTVPMTADGALDEAALDTATDAARTAEETYLARRGARVSGGTLAPDSGDGGAVTREASDTARRAAFGRTASTTTNGA